MSCAARPTCSPIWSSCSRSSAATRRNTRRRANRVIMRRNSCSAPPPWRHAAMTTISTTEDGPAAAPVGAGTGTEPDRDCPLCPRLAAFRDATRQRSLGWFNSPVPSFGDANARLLITGLAPGLQGANRTGRPFTGDYAGDLLYATLIEFGFAEGVYQARPDDGLRLVDCRISNAVRCVPPQNKPLPPEINTCRQFLSATIAAMPRLRAIVALGRIAHETVVKTLGLRAAAVPFADGASHHTAALRLDDSYHCSH